MWYSTQTTHNMLNTIEWVALFICIWEIPGSKLSDKNGYTDWGLSMFSSVSPGKWQNTTINQTIVASIHILPKSLFTIILPFSDDTWDCHQVYYNTTRRKMVCFSFHSWRDPCNTTYQGNFPVGVHSEWMRILRHAPLTSSGSPSQPSDVCPIAAFLWGL
jgi:hypothetical protein